jgi:hypothetical protein
MESPITGRQVRNPVWRQSPNEAIEIGDRAVDQRGLQHRAEHKAGQGRDAHRPEIMPEVGGIDRFAAHRTDAEIGGQENLRSDRDDGESEKAHPIAPDRAECAGRNPPHLEIVVLNWPALQRIP